MKYTVVLAKRLPRRHPTHHALKHATPQTMVHALNFDSFFWSTMPTYWCRRLGCSFLPLAGPGLVWGLLMWSIAAERGTCKQKLQAGGIALIDAHSMWAYPYPQTEGHVTTGTWMTLWKHCWVRLYFSLVFSLLLPIISTRERYSI